MASTPVNTRVQRHRDALRLAGFRPVQIWVPDTRRPGFAAECRRQSARVAAADEANLEEAAALEAVAGEAMNDIEGWTA